MRYLCIGGRESFPCFSAGERVPRDCVYPHGTRDAWGTFNLLALFALILVIWPWGAFSEASIRQEAAELGRSLNWPF